MRPFRPNDADDQSGRWGELLLDVEVVGLNVRILEVWIDGCGSEAARASDRGGVREHDRLRTPPLSLARAASDRKSTRLNSSHANISYAVFCLKKKKTTTIEPN